MITNHDTNKNSSNSWVCENLFSFPVTHQDKEAVDSASAHLSGIQMMSSLSASCLHGTGRLYWLQDQFQPQYSQANHCTEGQGDRS